MKLIIPKAFLEEIFKYLYYSILTDYELWDKKWSIIIEPIFFLNIENMKVVDWKFIDECINSKFEICQNRKIIEDELNSSDWSVLEQILYPISKNVFVLYDNPLAYPHERIEKFLIKLLPKNPNLSNLIDGICHFHPTGNARLSKQDFITMKDIGKVIVKYNKKFFISLVIAVGSTDEYIEKIKKSKNYFVNYMMNNMKNISIDARIFYPTNKDKSIETIII